MHPLMRSLARILQIRLPLHLQVESRRVIRSKRDVLQLFLLVCTHEPPGEMEDIFLHLNQLLCQCLCSWGRALRPWPEASKGALRVRRSTNMFRWPPVNDLMWSMTLVAHWMLQRQRKKRNIIDRTTERDDTTMSSVPCESRTAPIVWFWPCFWLCLCLCVGALEGSEKETVSAGSKLDIYQYCDLNWFWRLQTCEQSCDPPIIVATTWRIR